MIAASLFGNPRLLTLILAVIVVAGLSSFSMLPRMEDPVLGKRVGVVTTIVPGLDAEAVESQVTARLEEHLRSIADVKQIKSTSRSGIATIVLELHDKVTDVDPVWSMVRDRIADAESELPEAAHSPNFDRIPLKAFAALVAVKWESPASPNLMTLRRLSKQLRQSLASLRGTEEAKLFGDPGEELRVELDQEVLASMGLSVGAVAQQIRASDVSQPAGTLRTAGNELLLDLDEQGDLVQRLGGIRIRDARLGRSTGLNEIAALRRSAAEPESSLALVDGQRAVVVGAMVQDDYRLDRWARAMQLAVEDFREGLPDDISAEVVFSQSTYVEGRLQSLLLSLGQGTLAVVGVVFLLMGWRSTIVIAAALPLSALMVLTGMWLLDIPIHQMSVTGLIIALGLLIDNAIVIVDEVRARIWSGSSQRTAIIAGVRHLAGPLFGSTLTTTLAFAPIALLPGPPGEFVGSIAISVILAINSSFLLAVTVVPALTALLQARTGRRTVLSYGFHSRWLTHLYQRSLVGIFRIPLFGVVIGATLPLIGFVLAQRLPEQFFPPSDRTQIQLEIELPSRAALAETRSTAESIRAALLENDSVERVHWFLGESAPTFFYNLMPRRRGTPFYGQALIELRDGVGQKSAVRELQRQLDQQFAHCRLVVRQLEQGPPFDAPIEIRLRGPDLGVLQKLGSELRLILSETPHIVHTRSDLEETVAKLSLDVDQQAAQLAGLSHEDIARQLYAAFEGAPAGVVTDGPEELPVRVRLANPTAFSITDLASLPLQAKPPPGPPTRRPSRQLGPPLAALGNVALSGEVAAIPHLNGERMNEVKAYTSAGILPASVVSLFEQRLAAANFELPRGYSMEYGGEAAQRDQAVTDLLASGAMLCTLILITLVASFRSYRIALIIASVGGLSIGLGPGALSISGYPFGFMAIVGTMGLVGVAINDAIVVMAGIQADQAAREGDREAIALVVSASTRHVVATTLTTMAGFTPLIVAGGEFWPPLAITIAGGVTGATGLALYYVPALYIVLKCRGIPHSTTPEPSEKSPASDLAATAATLSE